MATTDLVKWLLLDSDLSTRIGGDLPVLSSNLYVEMNEPGSGEIRLPLDSTAASLIEAGMFLQCEYRGAIRGGFFVDAIKEVDADSSENAGRILSASGRSALALLDREIIYDDGTSESTRNFPNMTKAAILIQLIDEAQARGGLLNLTYDFSATDDSDANNWTDDESYSLTVGTKLLDVARQFCKTGGFDFDINLVGGSFVLSAYAAGMGDNLTSSVFFRIGANCQEVSRDERAGSEVINEYLVKYKGGYFRVSDAASIAANGRSVDILNIEQAQSAASATTYAAAKLAINKDPKENKSVKVWDGIAPNIFLDYNLGDTISLDRFGVVTEDRILGLQLDFSGETFASVIVDLNYIYYDQELKLSNELDRLMQQWNTAHDGGLIEVSYWADLKSASYINGMVYLDGYIYIVTSEAGGLGGGNGVSKYHIATGIWSPVGPVLGFPLDCTSICEYGGDIYITRDGGSILSHVEKWNGSVWTEIGEFTDDDADPTVSGVRHIIGYNDRLYVGGGGLLEVDGVDIHHHVAEYNLLTSTWASVSNTDDAQVDSCRALVILNGELYGGFDGTGTLTNEGFKRSTGTAWTAVNITNMDGKSVEALAVYGSGLVVACETKICLWDGVSTFWTEIGTLSGETARGMCFAVYLSDIYLGGDFSSINGVSGFNSLGRYSGGSWMKLGNAGATGLGGGEARALLFINSDLYIGGFFVEAGGKPAHHFSVYFTDFQHAFDHLSNAGNSFDMGAAIHNAPAEAITDADEFGFWEDVSESLRKITWSSIKSTLQTFFNTLFFRKDATNNPITGQVDIIPTSPGVGALYAETHGNALPVDVEQYTVNDDVIAPAHFIYRESSGTGDITAPMIEGQQTDTGAGAITGDWINFKHDAVEEFAVRKGGTVDIPTGQTYNIDGVEHTHAGGAVTGGELVMEDGVTFPPVPVEDEDGADWVYED